MQVFGNGGLRHRAAVFFPIRQQLVERARIDGGARQDVGPDFGAFFEHADDRDAAAAFAPPSPPAVVAPPAPAPAPRRPPAPSSPPTGPPPQRQWDEARPWVAADEALADIAEAASIVHASTSGQSLDPRALASVPWAHQIIELRTLIGAKGMETLSAGREPVPRFAVTWAKLRTQRAEIDRALRDRAAEAPAASVAPPSPPRLSRAQELQRRRDMQRSQAPPRPPSAEEPLRLHARITISNYLTSQDIADPCPFISSAAVALL